MCKKWPSITSLIAALEKKILMFLSIKYETWKIITYKSNICSNKYGNMPLTWYYISENWLLYILKTGQDTNLVGRIIKQKRDERNGKGFK